MHVDLQGAQSNSQSSAVSLFAKLDYYRQILFWRLRGPGDVEAADATLREAREIVATFERETGKRAADSHVVEVGFGARPRRAFALTLFFRQVTAIDLDAPVLKLSDLPRALRVNGPERALKSLVRHLLLDAAGWRKFHRRIASRFPAYRPQTARLLVGDAGAAATWAEIGEADLVFSQDVFEHIQPERLTSLLATLRAKLAAPGLVITRPMVFTGISGGHVVEWYETDVEDRTEGATAWRHLLDPGFAVNTYLNRLGRGEFVAQFKAAGFTVLADQAVFGRLGEKHMTPEKRAALSAYDDYELYSNRVEFLLA